MVTENESDSERDGFLSTRPEWHATAHGLYDGMRTWKLRPTDLPNNNDVQNEPQYYKAFYVIGTLIQLAIVILLIAHDLGVN